MPDIKNETIERNEISYTMPSQWSKSSVADFTEEVRAQKDKLMKLIIDTKEEAIELKIDGEQYRKIGIHDEWRQVDFGSKKAAYFSYQEKAAKDFIFRFNTCGILSDQVGMGKTIEAGMIISEMAYKNELGSLLILVPSDNMAEKWETELARKFGFRNFYKDLVFIEGKKESKVEAKDLPKVASIKTLDDFYSLIFNANEVLESKENEALDYKIKQAARELFKEIIDESREREILKELNKIIDTYPAIASKEFKLEVLKKIYAPLIRDFVIEIAKKLEIDAGHYEKKYELNLSGNYYHIADMTLDSLTTGIVENIFKSLVDVEVISNSIVEEFSWTKSKKGKEIIEDIEREIDTAKDHEGRVKAASKFKELAGEIRNRYAILIFSKIINYDGKQFNLLDMLLNDKYESESLMYCSVSTVVEKGYRVIDFLIDMAYRTLIVDEAHDYIKVSHKQKMRDDIIEESDYKKRQREAIEFTDLDLSMKDEASSKYFVFPLYNDYYYIEKQSLYLKVKALAERSYRKIFMTATPIKSDMIDFYLLYLLADNRETSTINRIRNLLDEKQVAKIASLLMSKMNNQRKRAMNYFTREDIVVKYIQKYYDEKKNEYEGTFEEKIEGIIQLVISEGSVDEDVLKEISVNSARVQFQQTFTVRDYIKRRETEIDSISDLVSTAKGIELWQNMYSQIGIRATRHQTFRLNEEYLKLINEMHHEKYRNLPIWSRRNGTLIYIHKKDNYFDLIVKNILENKKLAREESSTNEEEEIRKEIITKPYNQEKTILEEEYQEELKEIDEEDYSDVHKEIKYDEAQKKFDSKLENLDKRYNPKKTALQIYNYINEEMTGELQVADYYSTNVDYDEFKLHMIVTLMTDGLEIKGLKEYKRISGKVLLFADESTQEKVFNWLKREEKGKGKYTPKEISEYVDRFKHQPLSHYNKNKKDEEDRWVITRDIKALKEKKGNYLIVVEPNKFEEGVDLQASNILINFDIKFCPLKMEQRIGRIDRVKLDDKQAMLDIISFTPLNDMSGFMVDFLANELQMFSCWRGDTTGIVSMPLGEKPNSATFESAILAINRAYEALYKMDAKEFVSSCKNIAEMGTNFNKDDFKYIADIGKRDKEIFEDFQYLKKNSGYINGIVNNTRSESIDGDQGRIIFGEITKLAQEQALENDDRGNQTISRHKNELDELRKAILDYYENNIKSIEAIQKGIKDSHLSKKGSIEKTSSKADEEKYEKLEEKKNSFLTGLTAYKESPLAKASKRASALEKEKIDEIIQPILDKYTQVIEKYLNILLDLFEKFCFEVKDRAVKMTRFISHLTIEEFRAMTV